ncbi:MAG: hypothetical protein AAGB03_00980 [Pseudomonadota bacterium]
MPQPTKQDLRHLIRLLREIRPGDAALEDDMRAFSNKLEDFLLHLPDGDPTTPVKGPKEGGDRPADD